MLCQALHCKGIQTWEQMWALSSRSSKSIEKVKTWAKTSNARSKSLYVVRDEKREDSAQLAEMWKQCLSALKVWGGIVNLFVYCQRILAVETRECLRFSPRDKVSLNWVRDKKQRTDDTINKEFMGQKVSTQAFRGSLPGRGNWKCNYLMRGFGRLQNQ